MSIEERSVNQPEEQPSLSEQHLIRRAKLKELQDADQDSFQITELVMRHHSVDIKEGFETLEGATASVVGHIMSKWGMGKTALYDPQGGKGRIQFYVRMDELGEEAFAKLKEADTGDIVGVGDEVLKTKQGRISTKAHKVMLLPRSPQPLPEKFHGLTDKEVCYRQRYMDLIMNEDVRCVFRIHTAFIRHMRRYLDGRNYPEIETPIFNTISGGATARPFIAHHNILDTGMYIRIAAELNLKRFTVGGFEWVYEIGRILRNEGVDPKHNPEFTTIEPYEAYADFHDMIGIAEGVLSTAVKGILDSYRAAQLGSEIDLTPGWKRIAMINTAREYAGVDLEAVFDDEEACKAAEAKGIDLEGYEYTWGTALYEALDRQVKERLIQPTFITMYPMKVPLLVEHSPKDSRLIEHFELFINHCESVSAFSEPNDPTDQRDRLEHKLILCEIGNDGAGMVDKNFTDTFKCGPPPTGGMGIGIDRCVIPLTSSGSIRDAVLLPIMKPLGKSESTKRAVAETNCAVPAAERGPVDFSEAEIEPLFREFVGFKTFTKPDLRTVKARKCTAVPKSRKLLEFAPDDDTGEDRVILSGIRDTYEPEELVGKTLITITGLPPRKMMGVSSRSMIISAIHREESVEKLHCLMVDSHIPAGAKLY